MELARIAGLRPLPPPPEEARMHGRRHSKERDADAIAYHYDVSNDFYRIVLGPSMTYSCGVWSSPSGTCTWVRRDSTSTSARCTPALPRARPRFARRGFIDRYVFPDGELHEIGAVVSRLQLAGFEARNVEGLREHYALTLRAWVRNLEASWPQAVAEVGAGRARVWRLYMAASAINFEAARTQIHQVLAVRDDNGESGLALRPDWETTHAGST